MSDQPIQKPRKDLGEFFPIGRMNLQTVLSRQREFEGVTDLNQQEDVQNGARAMSTEHALEPCKAFYTDRRGAGCVRTVTTVAEAEKVLRGGYGAREARIEAPDGTVIGVREDADGRPDDRRIKWMWWLDLDPRYLASSKGSPA